MTGETYTFDQIRITERSKAIKSLERAKANERKCEELVKLKMMRKVVKYDPSKRLLSYRFVPIK